MRQVLLPLVFLLPFLAGAQGVAIGAGTPTPDASAILDLQSTTQGLLPPRMNTGQRTGIVSPATGLVVYDTSVGAMFVRTASAWVQLGVAGAGSGWSLTGNAATDTITNFVGTTDNKALMFRANNQFSGCIIPDNWNTSFGYNALKGGHAGTQSNVAIGFEALKVSVFPGISNVAVGRSAMAANQTGSSNTAVGPSVMSANVSGSGNTAVGSSALGGNISGQDNTAVGYRALFSNTSGYGNVAVGQNAMRLNTTKTDNVAVGDSALYNNGTGSPITTEAIENVCVGSKALFTNSTGFQNTAVGFRSMYANSLGYYNTALGDRSLAANGTGYSNTALGYLAMQSMSFGFQNTACGRSSLSFQNGGFNNSALGYSNGPASSLDGTTSIGAFATPTANNRINIGTATNNNLVGVYGAVQNLSDGRFKTDVNEDVPGLAFITKLRPVTYHLDAAKVDDFVGITARVEKDGNPETLNWYNNRIREVSAEKLTGFIAQEVEQAAKEVGYEFDGVQRPKNDGDHYTLGYSTFVVPLVKAVQEQQAQIEAQQRTIVAQQQAIEHMENRMNELMNR